MEDNQVDRIIEHFDGMPEDVSDIRTLIIILLIVVFVQVLLFAGGIFFFITRV